MLNKDFNKLFGEYARKYRKSVLGYTQDELADKIGVSRNTIIRFEKGKYHSAKVAGKLFELGMPYPEITIGGLK